MNYLYQSYDDKFDQMKRLKGNDSMSDPIEIRPETGYITTFDADEIDYIDGYKVVDRVFHEKHRWFNFYTIVFKEEETGKFYEFGYMEPASEMQEGQDRYDEEEYEGRTCVRVTEVVPIEKQITVTEWKEIDKS